MKTPGSPLLDQITHSIGPPRIGRCMYLILCYQDLVATGLRWKIEPCNHPSSPHKLQLNERKKRPLLPHILRMSASWSRPAAARPGNDQKRRLREANPPNWHDGSTTIRARVNFLTYHHWRRAIRMIRIVVAVGNTGRSLQVYGVIDPLYRRVELPLGRKI
jgi:hypothetical protein